MSKPHVTCKMYIVYSECNMLNGQGIMGFEIALVIIIGMLIIIAM